MPGPAGQLAVGLRHVRGAALVAAGDEADRRVVERRRAPRGSSRRERRRRCRRRGRRAGRRAACRRAGSQRRLLEVDRARAAASASRRRRDRRSGSSACPPTRAEHQHAHERRVLRLGRGGEHGSGPVSYHHSNGPYSCDVPSRLDPDAPVQQHAQTRPGMRVQVCDAARREVDAVAAHEPVALRPLGQLPHERAAVDARGAEVRLVALDVVDDVVAGPVSTPSA